MTISNRIEGIVRLISPLHCATVDGAVNSDKNITPTHKQVVNTVNGNQHVPYFPANDLRGRLRRHAARLVFESLKAKSNKITPDLYQALMGGSIVTKPESDLTAEEALRGRHNVYMGLFGGGTRLLRSRYCTNDLIPVLRDTIDAGIVPAAFGENGVPTGHLAAGVVGPLTGYQLFESRTSYRVDDIARMMNVDEVMRYIDDAATTVGVKQAEILRTRAERKADPNAPKRDLSNIMAIEVVARGTPLHCLIDIADDATDAHVGMLLLALRNLVREQALGGWIRCGMGRFSADLKLTRNGHTYQIFKADENAANATLTDEVQQAFCATAQQAIDALTSEEMMEFFTPRKEDESDEAKPARKGKKAAAETEAAA